MKKLILLFVITFSVSVFAQEVTTNVKQEQPNQEKVYTEVERRPEFPDGVNEFRNQIVKNFRTKKVKIVGSNIIKSDIAFTVERDGSIVDIKVTGENESFNQEAIRAVSKIKAKWIPAKVNDQVVRSRFRVPLKMEFE